MKASKLTPYSLGIVAENKKLNSKEIEVSPIEDLPMLDGELTGNITDYTAKATDAQGQPYQTETKIASTVTATWLAVGHPNRLTAPDVRRGEKVMLYRFADSDRLYWETLDNDLRFRKRETVVFGISATTDENAEPSPENTYTIEVSTHRKHLRILTTQADSEPFAYEIKLDTGEGKFFIRDNIGNTILLDSAASQIRLENSSGSFLDLTKDVITQHSDSEWNVTTQTANFKFSDFNVTATTTHTGDISHKGNMSRKGDTGLSGNMSVKDGGTTTLSGNLVGDADINLTGTIVAGKVVSKAPIDAPNV